MKKIRHLYQFRLYQAWRMLQAIGLGYLLFTCVVAFGLIMTVATVLVKSESSAWGLLGAGLIASIHFSRKDRGFLAQLRVYQPLLFFLEYLTLSVPFFLLFAFGENWLAMIVQFVGISLVAWVPMLSFSRRAWQSNWDFKFLPVFAFELRSQWRQYFLLWIGLYLVTLGLSFYTAAPLAMILLMSMSFAPCFDWQEGKELMEVFHFKEGIIAYKIRRYLLWYHLLLLPHAIAFLVFHLVYWYLLLAAFFLGSTYIIFLIFYKYAQFTPYRQRIYNSTASGLFFGAIILPFTYPVTLVYLAVYFYKVRKNIRFYYGENTRPESLLRGESGTKGN